MTVRRAGAGVAFIAAFLFVRPAAAQLSAPETAAVIARYEEAVDGLKVPPVVRFEYTVEQAGPRNFAQSHRVYRSGLNERDELRAVEGQALSTPEIRVIRDRVNRYAVNVIAPRSKDYRFTFAGNHTAGARTDFVFATVPHAPGAFAVDSVTIDGNSYLPRTIAYTSSNNGVVGHGTLTFAKADKYWVILEATATARINGVVARERITFSRYAFPKSLPDSIFTEPRPRTTPK